MQDGIGKQHFNKAQGIKQGKKRSGFCIINSELMNRPGKTHGGAKCCKYFIHTKMSDIPHGINTGMLLVKYN